MVRNSYGPSKALCPSRRRAKKYPKRSKKYNNFGGPFPSLPLAGFPHTQTVRLKYVAEINLNPSSGTLAVHEFRANGMFDPDRSGVGHQPKGFDEWMNVYQHFSVIKSHITVTPVIPTTTTNEIPGYYGIFTASDFGEVAAVGSVTEVMESYQGQTHGIAGFHSNMGSRKISPQLSKYFDAKQFFGVKNVVGESQYRGNASSDPSEQAYFTVWYGAMLGNDPAQADFLVEIEYVAVMSERKTIPAS